MTYIKTRFSAVLLLSIFVFLSGICHAETFTGDKPKPKSEIAYFSNGKVQWKGQTLNGLKHGRWEYFTEAGRIDHREKWKMGKMRWAIFYNEGGKKIRQIDAKGKETKLKGCGC